MCLFFVRKIEEEKNICEYVNEHRNGCREKVCFTLAVLSHESAFMEFCRNHEHSYIPVFAHYDSKCWRSFKVICIMVSMF